MSDATPRKNWRNAVIPPTATLQQAIEVLDRSALKIVLVASEDQRLIGTITDGDVRRGLLRGLALASSIESVVHREPFVVPPGMERGVVTHLMQANKLLQLPIVDGAGRIVGLHVWDEFAQPTTRSNLMVIMAGGLGTRLRPQTKDCPKPMLLVRDKPILEHILEHAKSHGVSHFVIAVRYLGEMIEAYFGDGSRWDVEIEYLREDDALGTAGALSLLPKAPFAPFLVANGDVLTRIRLGELLDYHVAHGASATMAVRQHELQNPFGVVRMEGVDIVGFEEKPVQRTYVNAGVYVLEPAILSLMERGKPCDMPSLLDTARAAGRRTVAYPIHEDWLDVGRPIDLEEARLSSG